MTDELPIVKSMKMVRENELTYRLRTCADIDDVHEAADRIERLTDELHHCFHRIEELQAALLEIAAKADRNCAGNPFSVHADYFRIARKALEGKDER